MDSGWYCTNPAGSGGCNTQKKASDQEVIIIFEIDVGASYVI